MATKKAAKRSKANSAKVPARVVEETDNARAIEYGETCVTGTVLARMELSLRTMIPRISINWTCIGATDVATAKRFRDALDAAITWAEKCEKRR